MWLKRFLWHAFVVLFVTATTPASAAPVRPSFSALPVASMPARPDIRLAPRSIGKRERVEGLDVRDGIDPRRARVASAFREPDSAVVSARVDKTCLTGAIAQRTASPTTSSPAMRPMAFRAPGVPRHGVPRHGVPRHKIIVSPTMVISDAIHAIRLQTLVQDASRPHLEITDAWVDPQTRGARLHRRTEIPLTLIFQRGLGKVFAFRDATRVWLVVAVPRQGVVIGPQVAMRSTCGHVLAELPIGPKGAVVNVLIGGFTHPEKLEAPGFSAEELSASISRASRDPVPVLSVTTAPIPREFHNSVAAMAPVPSNDTQGPLPKHRRAKRRRPHRVDGQDVIGSPRGSRAH